MVEKWDCSQIELNVLATHIETMSAIFRLGPCHRRFDQTLNDTVKEILIHSYNMHSAEHMLWEFISISKRLLT